MIIVTVKQKIPASVDDIERQTLNTLIFYDCNGA
jgi:hypothetical protein